jgi:hypothetical protein
MYMYVSKILGPQTGSPFLVFSMDVRPTGADPCSGDAENKGGPQAAP